MKLETIEIDKLPPLTWAIQVKPLNNTATLWHGQHVEVMDGLIVEGIWDGPFEEKAPHTCSNVFGSAIVIQADTIVLVSSSATTDYLYYHKAATISASNSLPMLLALTDNLLDPYCDTYHLINESITHGFNKYNAHIPTITSHITRLMYRNLVIGPDRITEVDKSEPPFFSHYEEYVSYLKATSLALFQNAKSEYRVRPMLIASTQSRGYDSTAVNALMNPEHIDIIFTIAKGKAPGKYADTDYKYQVDDDGSHIAKFLRIKNIHTLNRRQFELQDDLEALLIATLDSNQDANLFGLCGALSGPAILLTGTLGEIWYPEKLYQRDANRSCDKGLARGDLSMHGLTELRLYCSFVQVAIPFIGAIHRRDILQITSSREMDPWRIGTDYDRPIPRRIAEQAGVPREQFGQRKMASVVEFSKPYLPVCRRLRHEYQIFLLQNGLIQSWQWWTLPLVRKWNQAVNFKYYKKYRLLWYFEIIVSKLFRRHIKIPFLWTHLNGRIFTFGVNRRVQQYRVLLKIVPRKEQA
jgi:hypothetical protein